MNKNFKRHLKPYIKDIGTRSNHFYTVDQVTIIIEKLGLPPNMEVIDSRKMS